jgi:hypothetical protein
MARWVYVGGLAKAATEKFYSIGGIAPRAVFCRPRIQHGGISHRLNFLPVVPPSHRTFVLGRRGQLRVTILKWSAVIRCHRGAMLANFLLFSP